MVGKHHFHPFKTWVLHGWLLVYPSAPLPTYPPLHLRIQVKLACTSMFESFIVRGDEVQRLANKNTNILKYRNWFKPREITVPSNFSDHKAIKVAIIHILRENTFIFFHRFWGPKEAIHHFKRCKFVRLFLPPTARRCGRWTKKRQPLSSRVNGTALFLWGRAILWIS